MATIPFTPVDELGCHFDSVHEPNNVHLEVALGGWLDPARLHDAIAATLDAQPMARLHRIPWRGRDRRFHWRIADHPDPVAVDTLSWTTEPELAACRDRFLAAAPALDSAPPLRFGHLTGPSGDLLVLNAHHAAFDGLSCLHLLRDIARHYAAPPDPSPTTPETVTPKRHPTDPTASATGPEPAPRIPSPTTSPETPGAQRNPAEPTRTPSAAVEPDPIRRPFRPAARIAADFDQPAPGYGYHLVAIECRAGSGSEPVTVNDVLITALTLAVRRWNAEHDRAAAPIRITMPINARGPADSDALGNLSRLAVITATGGEPGTTTGLLTDVARQTLAAKRVSGPQVDAATRLLATPRLPLAVKARLVGAVRRLVAPWVTDTSLLSNLGRVADAPDFGPGLPATALWFSTPAPLPRGLSVGAVSLRDKLLLCFRYRRALFGAAAADRFAELFLAAVDSVGDPRLGR